MRERTNQGRRWFAVALAVALVGPLLSPDRSPTAAASELQPVEGFQPLVALGSSAVGAPVIRLQYTLKERGFYRGPIDGTYGRSTETAVIAFKKYLGLDRTADFGALDWIRIGLLPQAEIPHRWDEPDRVEIDITKQLLYVVRDQKIVGILPTSTGSGNSYFSVRNGRNVAAATPQGDFHLRWHQTGWNCDSVTSWCVYNYWAFTDFYGIHGYGQVPPWPASHGCSRVHTWDSDWLEDHLFVGMPVHVWTELPNVPPKPAEPLFVAV